MAEKTLAEALLAVQREAPTLQKNAINPHFRNKYVSLESLMEQILPILNAHDLVLLQTPTQINYGDEGKLGLRTRVIHTPTGDELADVMPLELQKRDPQGQGSAITYGRRYALMALLGLVADEDDDGNAAKRPTDKNLERKVYELGKKLTGEDQPTKTKVAKALGIKVGELVDRAVMERVLKEHGEL